MKFFMIFSLDMYALISLIIINNAYHFFKQQEQKEFLNWTVTFLMLVSSTSVLFAYMKCVNEHGMFNFYTVEECFKNYFQQLKKKILSS